MADDIPLVIGSSPSSAADDAHLDAAVRSTLPWATAALALTLGAAAAVALSASEPTVALVCAVAAGVELALAVVSYRWRARLPLADAWASVVVVVAAAAGVLSVVVSDDASWSLLVLVAVAAAGPSLVTMRWLIAVLYAVWVGWLAGLAAAELSTDALRIWLAGIAAVTALSVLGSVTRHRLVDALATAESTVDQVSVRDPLTGLVNRRGLALLGVQIVETARRQGDAVHCVFVDIDQLRHVNDILGPESGDEVLVAVGDALRSVTRSTDVVARWGGDEFCIIGPGAGMAPMELERRVRERVGLNPPVPDDVWSPRVVAGGAMLAPWDSGSLDTLLGKADQEMYLRRALRRGGGGTGRSRPSSSPTEQPSDSGG